MGIKLAQLSIRQQNMLDPEAAHEMGIQLPQERAEMALRGAEASEHTQLCGWLTMNGLESIHAPCSRRVKDLEPGWEDFTIFYRDRYLLVEIKVEGGVLSETQRKMHQRHRAKGMPVYLAGGYLDARNLIKRWLQINFGWTPSQ